MSGWGPETDDVSELEWTLVTDLKHLQFILRCDRHRGLCCDKHKDSKINKQGLIDYYH